MNANKKIRKYQELENEVKQEINNVPELGSLIIASKLLSNTNFIHFLIRTIRSKKISIIVYTEKYSHGALNNETPAQFNLLIRCGAILEFVDFIKEEFIFLENKRLLVGDLDCIFKGEKKRGIYKFSVLDGILGEDVKTIYSFIGVKIKTEKISDEIIQKAENDDYLDNYMADVSSLFGGGWNSPLNTSLIETEIVNKSIITATKTEIKKTNYKKENSDFPVGCFFFIIGIVGLILTFDKPFGLIFWIFLFAPAAYFGFKIMNGDEF